MAHFLAGDERTINFQIHNTMKKLVLLSFVMISFLSVNTFAQKHEIKANVGGALVQSPGIFYEYLLKKNIGIQGGLNYTWFGADDFEYDAISLTADFRIYFGKDNTAKGFFVSPYMKYRHTEATNIFSGTTEEEVDRTADGLALGIATGKKWVAQSGFTFELYFGIGNYIIHEVDPDELDFDDDNDIPTLDFRLGIGLGYRF